MKHLVQALSMLDKIQNFNFKKLLAAMQDEADFVVDWLLADFGIIPVIVGGLAVQIHGVRRFTEDVDILISIEDYNRLEEAGKIRFGQLKIKPGTQIDVLVEGKDGNPHPDLVRSGTSYFPSLEGLIYLKLISNRLKDQSDVVELIKANLSDPTISENIINFIPEGMREQFIALRDQALIESEAGNMK